jgi:hypothetical protein
VSDFIWGDASVAYPDWVGTAQLDQRATTWTIEQILGDQLDGWFVIGIDIGGGEHEHALRVIAVPKDSLPEGGGVLPEYASRNGGEIPATSFLVHDFNPYEFLRAITHMFELRLRVRSIADIPVRIVSLADIPNQN